MRTLFDVAELFGVMMVGAIAGVWAAETIPSPWLWVFAAGLVFAVIALEAAK